MEETLSKASTDLQEIRLRIAKEFAESLALLKGVEKELSTLRLKSKQAKTLLTAGNILVDLTDDVNEILCAAQAFNEEVRREDGLPFHLQQMKDLLKKP